MTKLASANLSAKVASILRDRIVRWEYPPGHRFTEEGLCAEFGMSRSPIREALRMLVENKLVDKTPHKGYSVKQLDFTEINELYDVRLALETFAVQRLIERGYPQAEWDDLHKTWEDINGRPATDSINIALEDENFHERLATWTGNRHLAQQLRTIDERLHFIRMTDIAVPGRLATTAVQHLRILECIKEGDTAGSREAVRVNIEDGRSNVEHAIKEALARAYLGPKSSV
jgi:DNA-binding GntR family transcriptional regulator